MQSIDSHEADRLAGLLARVQEMEAFLELVAATSATGLVITNRRGDIASCNDEIGEMFGYSAQVLSGGKLELLIRPNASAPRGTGVLDNLDGGKSGLLNVEGVRADGRVFPVQLAVARLRATRPEDEQLCISILDVSSRKAGEEEIRRSRDELQTVIDNSPGLICLKDASGHYLFVNQHFADFFHLDRQTVRGKSDHDLFAPKIAHTLALLDRAALTRDQLVREEPSAGKESVLTGLIGDRLLLTLRVPLRDSKAGLTGLLSVGEDITDSRARLAEIKRRLDEQRLIFDNSPTGILITSEDWIVQANPIAAQILGWDSPSALVGWETAEMFASPEDYAKFGNKVAPLLKAKQRAVVEWELYRRDRTSVSVKLSSQDMPVSDGADSTIWILEDISELKRVRVEQRTARELQEKLLQSKAMFLVNMSHEIRTPMSAILGFCELALDSGLNETQHGHVAKAHQAGQLMLGLLNQFLDFSKADARKIELDEGDFNLGEVLQTIDTVAGSAARARALGFEMLVAEEVPRTLFGDALRLQQVLINLANNAIKFTEHGGVVLQVSSRRIDDARVELEFAVRDTGIGIDPSYQAELFRAFEQADKSTSRKYGGTGLGLAISRSLVELLGGRIWLQASTPGQGCDFRFCVPFGTAVANLRPPPAPGLAAKDGFAADLRRLQGRRVMVVEDSESNREIAMHLLEGKGMEVVCENNGRLALDRLAIDSRFDLVLLDIQMPEMDGFETIARVRATPALQGLRVIALTAHAMLGERERCIDAGMDDFLTKPIQKTALFKMLLKWLPEKEPVGLR